MLFITIEDFYEKAASCRRLTRQEELDCAAQMKAGDAAARQRLIESYLPAAAGHIKKAKPHLQTLGLAVYCVEALEKAVDRFNFAQDSEPFVHHLSWALRQAVVSYMVR